MIRADLEKWTGAELLHVVPGRSHAKAMSIQIHPSCDLGDNADTPNSRRHQVIDFADLHKLRGITDLRRAIIAAERNNSLPSLVDEAR